MIQESKKHHVIDLMMIHKHGGTGGWREGFELQNKNLNKCAKRRKGFSFHL